MALIRRYIGSTRTTAVLTFGLVVNLAPLATFAAVMPQITEDWGLTASEAGWIGESTSPGTAPPSRYWRA
jgi:hypothetical protein